MYKPLKTIMLLLDDVNENFDLLSSELFWCGYYYNSFIFHLRLNGQIIFIYL